MQGRQEGPSRSECQCFHQSENCDADVHDGDGNSDYDDDSDGDGDDGVWHVFDEHLLRIRWSRLATLKTLSPRFAKINERPGEE